MDALPILLNERAGHGPDAETVERAFRDAGLEPDVQTVPADRLRERLLHLRGAPRVGVCGGDGSLQTAAAVLCGSDTTLVPIPGGHLNHFARRLGLDSPAASAEAAAAGRVREVSVGVVGEHVFLNTAIVGAYPYVIRLRERMRRFVGIWPAATLAGLWVWARWPRFGLTIRTGDLEIFRRTTMVWIGTGPGSFPAPHEAPIPEDRYLEIVILPSARRRHALRLVRALWANRQGRDPQTVGLEVLRAPRVELDSRHRIRLTLDAEPVTLAAPVVVALDERSLRVAYAPNSAA